MAARIKVFLDTSALFAGAWSLTGGAHLILKLGEVHSLDIWLSSRSELEKAPGKPRLLGDMALAVDRASSLPDCPPGLSLPARPPHPGDAQVARTPSALAPITSSPHRKHFWRTRLCRTGSHSDGHAHDFLAWSQRLA
jgi:hypothetical protein